MLGEKPWLVAIDDRLQAGEVRPIERAGPAYRQPYAMHRKRIVAPDLGQEVVRPSAGTHVVLCMHLEPGDTLQPFADCRSMLGLQAHAGAGRDGLRTGCSACKLGCRTNCGCRILHQPAMGLSEPLRFLPSGNVTSIFSHVPFFTPFHSPPS